MKPEKFISDKGYGKGTKKEEEITMKKVKITEELWKKVRQEVDNELSQKQALFCICGKLATGLHEKNCKRYNSYVDRETLKRLKQIKIK